MNTMPVFPAQTPVRAERLIRTLARLLALSVFLLPLVPVLYLQLFQSPELRQEDHMAHMAAIALATLEGAGLTYVCWLCYQRSGELLVKRMTQGFMAFTLVYSLHGVFTPVAHDHLELFILYGPASRLAMGLLLLSVRAQQRPVETVAQRGQLGLWWRFLLLLLGLNGAVALLAGSALGQQAWPRLVMEGGALLCDLLALAMLYRSSAGSPLMRLYMLALAWFATASAAFLLAQPWNHMWWLAHGLFAVGFSMLGYGVLKAYLSSHALERVFSTEDLFEDLAQVNARLVQVFQEYQDTNSSLQAKLLELERSRHGFATLLEAVPDAVCIVEAGGRIAETNGAAEQLLGYAPRALLGVQVESLIPDRMRAAHVAKRQRFEFAPRTRYMGAKDSLPLPCQRRDGSVFLAHVSIGGLVFEGQQCVVTFIRPVTQELAQLTQQRQADQLLMARGQLLDAVLASMPGMVFELQRQVGGSYSAGVRSAACTQGLQLAPDVEAADWVKQWFNLVVPADLPQLLSGIETASLQEEALQLQWRHHVPGRGVQAFALAAGPPLKTADGGQSWVCNVRPLD